LAVLELKNLSSNEEQQYFCEGVSEELINTLSRLSMPLKTEPLIL